MHFSQRDAIVANNQRIRLCISGRYTGVFLNFVQVRLALYFFVFWVVFNIFQIQQLFVQQKCKRNTEKLIEVTRLHGTELYNFGT